MDKKAVQQIMKHMDEKTTEELNQILQKRDLSQWSEEAFEAITQVLTRRSQGSANIQFLEKQTNIEALIGIVTTSDPTRYSDDERDEAAQTLTRINATEALGCLIMTAKDSSISIQVRANVIRAIGVIRSSGSVDQLIILLEDRSKRIREEALEALKKIADPKANESSKMKVCHVCGEHFPRGLGNRSLCVECSSLNKISIGLYLFSIAILLNSLGLYYFGYTILGQSYYRNIAGIFFFIEGSLSMILFLMLLFKIPGTRGYMFFMWIASYLLSFVYMFVVGDRVILDSSFFFSLIIFEILLTPVWLFYLKKSKRMRVIYGKKVKLDGSIRGLPATGG